MKLRRIALFVALLILAVVIPARADASYKSELNRATKRTELYELLTGDAKALSHATLFTDRFRKAFAEHHAKIHYMTPAQKERFIAAEEAKQPGSWEIFLGIYTRPEYRKITMGEDSFWKVFLQTSYGESAYPTKIEKVKKITPYWKVMFPYLGRWDDAYILQFPKVAGDEFTLFMQSVVGETQVTWKIK